MTSQFQDKVAIVTGAGSGIGRATSVAFAEHGASVVVVDVDIAGSEETVRLIREAGGSATFVHCDVSKPEDVVKMVDATIETYGRLDFACNNAGIGGAQAPTGEYPIESWNKVIGINLTGVWLCMRYQIPAMLKSGGGSIVNMASILGQVGFAGAPAYVAAKHGVVGLTKSAAIEYATQGIRVNAICPGFIYTPLLEHAGMSKGTPMYDMVAGLHPMKRMGTSEEVASAVIWLCEEGASFVTGESILVDGGYVAQ